MSGSSAVKAEEPWAAEVKLIAESFEQVAEAGRPRYVQLQSAITRLVESGQLRAGMQLAPEAHLAAAVGISLGTVQKTLNRLASEGWITREHGRGTFVAEPRRPITELWHYRFIDPESGRLLPVYARLIGRRLLPLDSPLMGRLPQGGRRITDAIGRDREGLVQIERLIDIDGRLECFSRMYLGATRFGRLLSLPSSAVEGVNLKQLFAAEFAAPTLGVTQIVRAEGFDEDAAAAMRVPSGTSGLVMEVAAQTHGGAPLSFQTICIPPSPFGLDVSPYLIGSTTSRSRTAR